MEQERTEDGGQRTEDGGRQDGKGNGAYDGGEALGVAAIGDGMSDGKVWALVIVTVCLVVGLFALAGWLIYLACMKWDGLAVALAVPGWIAAGCAALCAGAAAVRG